MSPAVVGKSNTPKEVGRVGPVPWFAGTVSILLAVRYIARRLDPTIVILPDGRRLKRLSSIALLNRTTGHLLALEYRSALPTPDPEDLQREAHAFLQAVAAKPAYAKCRTAAVTARTTGENQDGSAPRGRVFAFRRDDTDSDWYPVPRTE
jgi:hypothetical protein